ncbi:hypothetical protein N665_0008s0037 [Sinapis alba]|nr:hypothetical protein N665_0008s0037 [Sinapis alba]
MQARHGQSSYRDRTDEFSGIVESRRRSIAPAAPPYGGGGRRREDPPRSAAANQSEFSKRASLIGLAIHQTSQKLSKLAQLAKRSSVFDDPTREIQELTVVIKQEISGLNGALLDLQAVRNSHNDDERNISRDTTTHSATVVDDLKNRLMDTTKEFKDVLTLRTENMKIQEDRMKKFSKISSKESANPFVHQRPLASKPSPSQPAPLPWANGASSSSSSSQLVPRQGEAESSPLLQQSQQQQMVPLQDTYMQSRAEALHNVESTIHELSSIFTQLATMVSQQGEIAIRIDQNMEDTLANVEGAQSQLARYLNSISSNRWLMIKIFFVLIAFLMVFLFFVA